MQERKIKLKTSGRSRPAYKPRQIKCTGCGAALSVKDERSELLVCEYCGSQLDISGAEQRVLGKNPPGKPDFTFEIGDSYFYRAARFECLGRVAFMEDGDLSDMTLEYLFYHPCRGAFWIGEYGNGFSMTGPCHVMPLSDGLALKRGDMLQTYDNNRWICQDSGVYELFYVDGALPWIALKGDRVQYAEFAEESGSGRIYEIERIKGEIEYGSGKRLDIKTVRAAAKRPDIGQGKEGVAPPPVPGSDDAAVVRRRYFQTMQVAGVLLLINMIMAVWCWQAGTTVLSQYIKAGNLTRGFFTDPFELSGNNNAVRVIFDARIDNAWMSLEAMLVRSDQQGDKLMVHSHKADIQYYSGYEGGEHWSEGSTSDSMMVRVPDSGTYQLFIQGVSADGNTADADSAHHDIMVKVTDRAQLRPWFIVSSVVCLIILVITAVLYAKWKEDEE